MVRLPFLIFNPVFVIGFLVRFGECSRGGVVLLLLVVVVLLLLGFLFRRISFGVLAGPSLFSPSCPWTGLVLFSSCSSFPSAPAS